MYLPDEFGQVDRLAVVVSGYGFGAGHKPKGKSVGCQECHDILSLHVWPTRQVDQQEPQVLPVAARGREREEDGGWRRREEGMVRERKKERREVRGGMKTETRNNGKGKSSG